MVIGYRLLTLGPSRAVCLLQHVKESCRVVVSNFRQYKIMAQKKVHETTSCTSKGISKGSKGFYKQLVF